MRCEVAVISLTYLVWKKKEEESIFTAEDMGAGEGFEIDRGWEVAEGGRSALSSGGTGQGRRGTAVGTRGMRWSRRRFRGASSSAGTRSCCLPWALGFPNAPCLPLHALKNCRPR